MDNTTINPGASGDTISTDDLSTINGIESSGVKVQRVKVGFGNDSDLRDVSADYPMPMELSHTSPIGALLQKLVDEQKETNKLLRKIYQ